MTTAAFQIRAHYNRDSIVVYQAFGPKIADAALEHGTFQAPFSFRRMTWIKPSFLWLMARSQWGQRSGQERILAVQISREGWESALSEAVLTSPEPHVYPNGRSWQKQFDAARVHVQWDPERSIRGAKLEHRSIQVGISRHLIREYVDEWILEIEDITPQVHKLHRLVRSGDVRKARRQLPPERIYPVSEEIAARLGI